MDKLQSVAWRAGRGGAPILEAALGYFECCVVAELPTGDHRLVLSRVVDGTLTQPAAVPLIYAETGNLDGSEQLYPDAFADA